MIRAISRQAVANDPFGHLAATILYCAILDARDQRGTYRHDAILFLNSDGAAELAKALGVEAWPRWTHERARRLDVVSLESYYRGAS